jgi:hypothetical protein
MLQCSAYVPNALAAMTKTTTHHNRIYSVEIGFEDIFYSAYILEA